jgi:hypothetical protein
MTILDFLIAIAPLPLGLIAALLAATAMMQPRRATARSEVRIREASQP